MNQSPPPSPQTPSPSQYLQWSILFTLGICIAGLLGYIVFVLITFRQGAQPVVSYPQRIAQPLTSQVCPGDYLKVAFENAVTGEQDISTVFTETWYDVDFKQAISIPGNISTRTSIAGIEVDQNQFWTRVPQIHPGRWEYWRSTLGTNPANVRVPFEVLSPEECGQRGGT